MCRQPMSSNLWTPHGRRAAAFSTTCSLSTWYTGAPAFQQEGGVYNIAFAASIPIAVAQLLVDLDLR